MTTDDIRSQADALTVHQNALATTRDQLVALAHALINERPNVTDAQARNILDAATSSLLQTIAILNNELLPTIGRCNDTIAPASAALNDYLKLAGKTSL